MRTCCKRKPFLREPLAVCRCRLFRCSSQAIYDERTKDYRGKLRVIGRIAGQMASMIITLLKTDYETLSQGPPNQEPPPMLYDPATHRKHQEGHYRLLKPGTYPGKIIQLPHSC